MDLRRRHAGTAGIKPSVLHAVALKHEDGRRRAFDAAGSPSLARAVVGLHAPPLQRDGRPSHLRRDQWDRSSGTGGRASMLLVAPPRTNSLIREWPYAPMTSKSALRYVNRDSHTS